jgi:hypothetical protein
LLFLKDQKNEPNENMRINYRVADLLLPGGTGRLLATAFAV